MTDKSRIQETNIMDTVIGKIVADLDLPNATCNMQYRSILDKVLSPFFMLIVLEMVYQTIGFISEEGGCKEVPIEHYI